MNQNNEFVYWKKPWHRWMVLGAVVLQAIALYLKIQDFQKISRPEIRNQIFSQLGWETYVADQHFQFALSIMMICIFLYSFIIGFFVHSKKTLDVSMSILWIIVTLFWGIVGFVIPVFGDKTNMTIWLIILLISFVATIFSIRGSRRL